MPRLITLGLVSLTALMAMIGTSDAQNRRRAAMLGSSPHARPRRRSGYWQTQSYLVSPPWNNMRDRFGEGALHDPIHGVFIGARNPFGPVDYGAPAGLR